MIDVEFDFVLDSPGHLEFLEREVEFVGRMGEGIRTLSDR